MTTKRSTGLARRLADFFDHLATDPKPYARRVRFAQDRYRLAVQLLGTISPQVLAETGHLKPPARVPAATIQHRRPCPPPVGDLARPRIMP